MTTRKSNFFGWQAILIAVFALLILVGALYVGATMIFGDNNEVDADVEATVNAILPTLAPTNTPGAASSGSLVVNPMTAAPTTALTVTGAGFPPNGAINLSMGPATAGAPAQQVAQTTADQDGVFVFQFTVPAAYPDGTTIEDGDLIIVATSADGSVTASAALGFSAAGAPAATTDPNAGGVPDATEDTSGGAVDSGEMAIYSSDVLSVTFEYPIEWQIFPDDIDHYAGATGFVAVTAAGSTAVTLEEVCATEYQTELQPYGSTPTVEYIDVAGRPACLILPSADQAAVMEGQAALVITYPAPITIDGLTYAYLMVFADQAHLLDPISATLAFLTQ